MSDPVIRVDGLTTHYGDHRVLDGIDFCVEPGEIVVIMGGSGSGKSTLLNHLLGLLQPTSGRVEILGTEINACSSRELEVVRRRTGVAFQSGALFSSLSVGDNIRLPLEEHTRLDRSTIDIMMRLKLEAVELAGNEAVMPAQLSGGMVKRAALARAVVMDPKLLFCDEPSAGLDPVVAASVDQLIVKLRDALGMSIVVVTHELESAFTIADRILVLDQGTILASGTPAELRDHPNERLQNLFNRRPEVAAFDADAYLDRLMGSGNL